MKNIQRGTIIIVAVAFAIFLINVPVSLTPSSSFCSLCHGGEHQTWKSSSHQKIPCNDCHRRPDFFAFASHRIEVLRMTGNYLTHFFYERPVKADVPSEACQQCHSYEETKTLVVRSLRISHKEPVKAGYECTLCHSKVVHNNLVPSPDEVNMNKCLSCHNGQEAAAECDVCHLPTGRWVRRTTQGPWQLTHGEQWRRLHGMGNLNLCSVCHRRNFCARCHGIDLPHPDSWLNLHGPIAKQNRQSCLSCHREQLCTNCHKVKMPHPASFLPKHAEEMRKLGKQKCLECHVEQGCNRCHTTHIHPGLPADRLERLRREVGLE